MLLVGFHYGRGVNRGLGNSGWFNRYILRGLDILVHDVKVQYVNCYLYDGSGIGLNKIRW